MTVDEIEGVLVVTPAGIAGRLAAELVIDLQPAIEFDGRIELVINNATSAIRRTVVVGGVEQVLDVPAGPFLRVEITGTTPGTPATLTVLGLTIAGNFVLERSTTGSGASIVRIGMSQVGLDLGGVVTLSNGTGVILLLPADPGPTPGSTVAGTGGLAGTISADVAVNIPGVTFSGSFGLRINTTNGAVNDSITVGGVPLTIDLPAGPYLRVEGVGVTLGVAGVALTGNFAFQRVGAGTTAQTVILASDVSLSLGGDAIEIFDGSGAFVIKPAGLAGALSVSIRANLGGAVTLGGTVKLEINQTGAEVDDSFELAGETITLDLPEGPYLRVALTGIGGAPAFLEIAGQRLTAASFSFEQQSAKGPDGTLGTADDVKVLRIAASGVGLDLGDGLVVISGGTLALEKTAAGLAGVVRATITVGAPGSALDGIFSVGATVTVMINQRATAATFDRSWLVDELTATVVDAIFGTGAALLPAGPYLRVEAAGIFVDVLGGAFRLTGDFAFEQATTAAGAKVVRIGLANINLDLVPGVVSLTNGSGLIVLSPGGLAASIEVTPVFTVSGFSFTGTFRISINNRTTAVSESFVVGGTAAHARPAGRALPAGRRRGHRAARRRPDAARRLLVREVHQDGRDDVDDRAQGRRGQRRAAPRRRHHRLRRGHRGHGPVPHLAGRVRRAAFGQGRRQHPRRRRRRHVHGQDQQHHAGDQRDVPRRRRPR